MTYLTIVDRQTSDKYYNAAYISGYINSLDLNFDHKMFDVNLKNN